MGIRIRITALLTACAFWASACSLITMRRPPEEYRPYQQPRCSSTGAPAFDTVASAAALAGAVIFAILADTSDYCDVQETCHHLTPGGAFGLAVGMSALSLAFGLSAYTGYGWSGECDVVEADHREWDQAMYPALQVARVETLRRDRLHQCLKLKEDWRRKIATASMQLKECRSFMQEYRHERRMLAATTLHLAVERGEIDELKKLLAQHPNINIQDRRGWTALHWAAQLGRPEAAAALLTAGVNPDARDRHGAAPLHLAAFAGHLDVIGRLSTADFNARTESGATPLHAAVLGGRVEAARALLERGADPGAQDDFGRTPRFYAEIVKEPGLLKLLAP
jgi:hypothetical protein